MASRGNWALMLALLQILPKFLNCERLFGNPPRWLPAIGADKDQGSFRSVINEDLAAAQVNFADSDIDQLAHPDSRIEHEFQQ